jgi:hypothetical protein
LTKELNQNKWKAQIWQENIKRERQVDMMEHIERELNKMPDYIPEAHAYIQEQIHTQEQEYNQS